MTPNAYEMCVMSYSTECEGRHGLPSACSDESDQSHWPQAQNSTRLQLTCRGKVPQQAAMTIRDAWILMEADKKMNMENFVAIQGMKVRMTKMSLWAWVSSGAAAAATHAGGLQKPRRYKNNTLH